MWKEMISIYDVIGDQISWNIRNKKTFRIGYDSYIGSTVDHMLPENMIDTLFDNGHIFLFQIHDPNKSNLFQQEWLSSAHLGFTGDEEVIWNINI